MYSDDELLALSGIQHFSYCERQWRLIHLEQVWEESADTIRGDVFHDRVDMAGYTTRDGVRCERSVHIVSHALGIYGVADIVEFSMNSGGVRILPVEYKVGKPKTEDWDRLQVTAQVMCLEEMLDTRIAEGALFYGQTRRRERVSVTAELRERIASICARMHEAYARFDSSSAVETKRCRRCSLRDACMPVAMTKSVSEYWRRMIGREFG